MKEFLSRLVRVETTAEKGELAAAEIISAEFEKSGIESTIDSWDGNRANVVARVKSEGSGVGLLFACHIDVVPVGEGKWKYPPFDAVEEDGRIYGRGSADMKSGNVAAVTAIREIVDAGTKLKGDIIFLGAAGEETDSCGARRFVHQYGSEVGELAGVVIPEPTRFEVVTAHRGMLWLEVSTKGKTAHGSMPHLGINAISSMKAFLDELEKYEIRFEPHKLLGGCSMSVNRIDGGKAINVVPDECKVWIDIRTLPGQEHKEIISGFEKIFAKLKEKDGRFAGSISVAREMKALETDCNCDFVKQFCSVVGTEETKAVGFSTDGSPLAVLGAPVIIFGPGRPEVCHKPDEYVDISDVENAVEYYKNIILNFLT